MFSDFLDDHLIAVLTHAKRKTPLDLAQAYFNLCTLCGALGISFGFLLKALDVNQ